jgi:hypothetical protein
MGISEIQNVAGVAVPPNDSEILAALERVLASDGFAGSAQLSRFLRYAVEQGIRGTTAQLKESVIGVAVFNRGTGYDPKTDPVVRVEARRLRAKLEAFYAGPGAEDPVRILLPKGGYAPQFEAVHAPAAVPGVEPTGRTFRLLWIAVPALLLLAMLGAIGYYLQSPERVVERFWSSILDSDKPALAIPADSALVMLENLSHRPVSLGGYMSGEYRAQLSSQSGLDHALLYDLAGRRYTSIADLEFVSRISHRVETRRRGLLTRYARDVRVEDLKQRNVILLGARMSNPWVELFEKDATLRLDDDPATGAMKIRNLAPAAGEAREITMSSAEMRNDIYGIVTYHRNREGSGIAMIVAGMTVAGTEAAADFLLDDSRMVPWLRKAREGGDFKGFDILLRGRNLAGSAPRAEVIAMHVER